MATATASNFTKNIQESELVRRVVWQVFNQEKGHFNIKVLFFNFDATPLVESWLTAHFGADPGLTSDDSAAPTSTDPAS